MVVFDSAAESHHWVTSTLTDSWIVFYNFRLPMDETPIYRKSWFFLSIWGVIWLLVYGFLSIPHYWTETVASGNLFVLVKALALDGCLFGASLLVWVGFFAQFVLPVRTFKERQKIFDRLMAYVFGLRGPAISIKNGRIIERPGEAQRDGAGVVWLDSASAAVTHEDIAFKQVIGPGVHFTEKGERIAQRNVVDLHIQSQGIGPREKEDPFAPPDKAPSEEEYKEIQKRRVMTSAWTRDGIEVIPNISVTFKIDADPVKGNQPGSHFGFSEEAVRKAIIGQAVNYSMYESRMAWNELPAYVAADLWREYMGKFRLKQLFENDPELYTASVIEFETSVQAAPQTEGIPPIRGNTGKSDLVSGLADMLHVINRGLLRFAEQCEKEEEEKRKKENKLDGSEDEGKPFAGKKSTVESAKTALTLINDMIKQRMTRELVYVFDRNGQIQSESEKSREYKLLKERGIRILSVSVNNLRFSPEVEKQILTQWSANWLDNAQKERERIETARSYAALDGQENAVKDYARDMAENTLKARDENKTLKQTVQALLLRSRTMLIRGDRMHRRASNELHELEDALQWLESDQS